LLSDSSSIFVASEIGTEGKRYKVFLVSLPFLSIHINILPQHHHFENILILLLLFNLLQQTFKATYLTISSSSFTLQVFPFRIHISHSYLAYHSHTSFGHTSPHSHLLIINFKYKKLTRSSKCVLHRNNIRHLCSSSAPFHPPPLLFQ
jgi:hypothetical protein